jgi:hypothetical protein
MKIQKKENRINTNQAIEIVISQGIHCTRTSLLTWVNKYQLGKKVGGRWYIDSIRLEKFLEGKSGVEK